MTAQRFVHLAALLPRTEDGYNGEPAFPEKAVLPKGRRLAVAGCSYICHLAYA